jgi:murein DD-endopeptidase MepM/ murein hydrolase activator NlpD
MPKFKIPILALVIVSLLGAIFFVFKDDKPVESQVNEAAAEKKDRIERLEIKDGSTYGLLMSDAGIDVATSTNIYEAAKDKYDLVKIRAGYCLELIHDKDTDVFKELRYKIDTEQELIVKREGEVWQAELRAIPYEIKIKKAEGVVKTSMYEAALDNNIDERAIIELADAFQWSLDFSQDPRVGDTFAFTYEERYLDNEYVMPGRVLIGKYNNDGTEYKIYYFAESSDNIGYFDEAGNSVQKMFLKAPVAFKYISSGYTNGRRYIEAFNVSTNHRAVDYAASAGTPIRAVGDGTVVYAGWKASYGNFTSIRHNSTYTTNYAHQSKFAVKTGQKVKQGQIIGYVGSTGFSTGPHLHYEMVKNGVLVNPLKEVLPPGTPIKEENKERFNLEKERLEKL